MGRQSATIRFNGKDHKEIRLNGNFHDSAHKDSNVLWEKILNPEVYEGFNITAVGYSESVLFQAKGNFTVNWGDGQTQNYNYSELNYVSHSYSKVTQRNMDVWISGNVTDISFSAANGIYSFNNALPPSLSGKTDFSTCFAYMNKRTTTINKDLFKYCKSAQNFTSCFYNSRLAVIPEGLFRNCKNALNFSRCFASNQVISVPSRLFANLSLVTSFEQCFEGNQTTLKKIGEKVFENCLSVIDIGAMFSFTAISELPEGIFDSMVNLEDAKKVCFQCTGLKSVPYTLFDKCNKLNDVYYAFYNCKNITSKVPPLWEREWEDLSKYHGCYYNCSPENDADIPWIGWSEADD